VPDGIREVENEDCAKLLVNIKLLKESLRATSAVGGDEFLRELAAEVNSPVSGDGGGGDGHESSSSDGGGGGGVGGAPSLPLSSNVFRESTWLVKRAISEFHVMHNRRHVLSTQKTRGGSGGGGAAAGAGAGAAAVTAAEAEAAAGATATAAEFALAGQLTECRGQLANEKRSRRAFEKQASTLDQTLRAERVERQAEGDAWEERSGAAVKAAAGEARDRARREVRQTVSLFSVFFTKNLPCVPIAFKQIDRTLPTCLLFFSSEL
jgi:hypothetical protein